MEELGNREVATRAYIWRDRMPDTLHWKTRLHCSYSMNRKY